MITCFCLVIGYKWLRASVCVCNGFSRSPCCQSSKQSIVTRVRCTSAHGFFLIIVWPTGDHIFRLVYATQGARSTSSTRSYVRVVYSYCTYISIFRIPSSVTIYDINVFNTPWYPTENMKKKMYKSHCTCTHHTYTYNILFN